MQRHGLILGGMLFVFLGSAFGQTAAVLVGSVKDPSGAIVAGAQIRATDLAVRRGAHDFWLVLPETPDRAARVVGERLRLELGTRELALAIGIASFPNDGLSAAELVSAADKALARSIELGGNRTVLFSVPRNAPPGWGLARAS